VQKCRSKDHARLPSANTTPGRRQSCWPSPRIGAESRTPSPRTTGAEWRVVVSPPTLPKNVIAILTRAGEPSGRRCSGGLLFHLVCAQETEREAQSAAGFVVAREMNGKSPLRVISTMRGRRWKATSLSGTGRYGETETPGSSNSS